MPFDPTVPRAGTPPRSAEIRDNFNARKAMIDVIPADPPGPPEPQGEPGPQGSPGEVTAQQLTDAIAGTSANSNTIQLLDENADQRRRLRS